VQSVKVMAVGGQGDEAEALQVRDIKLCDKNRALEMLAKIHQLYVERRETRHTGLEDLLEAIQGGEKNSPIARLRSRMRDDDGGPNNR